MMTFHHVFPLPLIELIGGDWCVLNGPVTYISFNSEVRSDWLQLIGLKAVTKNITYMNTFMRNKVGSGPNAVSSSHDKQLTSYPTNSYVTQAQTMA
uniref:Uncharacterized protein n=1 Tax=Acrobeloides nanus TaxID=290746 RepID=A0A914D455_9BILA